MWPWGQKKNNVVSVSLSPQHISCCWADTNKGETITINAYEKKRFASLEFEKSTVFNPTKISRHIGHFLRKNNIEKPTVSFCVAGPNIFEKIVTLSKSCPDKNDFSFPELQQIHWNHTYLCPSTKNGFHFYVHGMAKETLFQYRLLAIKSGIKLHSIQPSIATYLQLYKHIKGKNYTQSQFAIDLSENQYDMQSIFTPKLLKKHFNFGTHIDIDVKNEIPFLAMHLGLFFG